MYLQRNQRNIDRLNDATDIGGQGKENGMENIGIDENDESVVILSESTVIWSDRDLFWSESVVIWSESAVIWSDRDLFWSESVVIWSESVVIWSESVMIWSKSAVIWSESVMIWSDRDLIWFEDDQNSVLLDEIYPGKLGINLKIYIFS